MSKSRDLADLPAGSGDINIDGGTIDGVTIGGASAGAGTFTTVTGSGDMNIDSGTLFVDASANAVGIGTTSPAEKLHVSGGTNDRIVVSGSGSSGLLFENTSGTALFQITYDDASTDDCFITTSDDLVFRNQSGTQGGAIVERGRIDSSGNLLVSTTQPAQAGNTSDASAGIALLADNSYQQSRSGVNMYLNRLGSDGEIAVFRKDGSTVGRIGSVAGTDVFIAGNRGGTSCGVRFTDQELFCVTKTGATLDNFMDCGHPAARFDDINATNGTIQTSDRNEKQDIETLSEAEQRVAVAAKSLLRKFRWKDRVAEKGDDARIHFGIIAQDLQAAFEAEGLDAGRYAMFTHSEWWETYTDVPAVEAQDAVYETVTDEEGNETQVLVSEAVEAQEAYTHTEVYKTEEEAPEDAVKKSRMGVRYSELLAFIIAAI